MKKRKLIVLFLSICILMILMMGLASCYRNGNIKIEDIIVKYDGKSHAVVATNDINGDFIYRYISKELDYDSEQAPIEVGKYTVTVSKEGYKTANCNLQITTDFLFDNNGNVIGVEKSIDSVLYIPSKIKGKEVKEIKSLELSETVKEMYLPSTLERITSLMVENETVVYLTSTPNINSNIDLSNIFFNIDNIDGNIASAYFANNKITRIDILGANSSSIKAVENIANTVIDTVYLREDSKLEKALPSNIKMVVVNYAYEIQNNFLVEQGLIENFILTTNEEIILVKSDSFINLTEVTNFMPSKNIYFSDWTRELHKTEFNPTPEKYMCDSKNLPNIDKLIIEDNVEEIGVCQYLWVYCNEVIIPDTLKKVEFWGLATGAKKIDLPDSLEYIGDRGFYRLDITKLKLPSNVRYIGYEAFAYCYEISGELVLPESLEYLGERAFYWCDNLSKVVDNSKIKTISSEAFSNCWMLTNYVFNNVLESIEYAAFDGTHMRNGNLPDSLKHIGKYALYVNEDINVVIPEGIEEIGDMPFCYIGQGAISKSPKYTFENGYLIRTADRVLMSIYERDNKGYLVPEIEINGLCNQIYEDCIRKGVIERFILTINSSIKEYKYDKPIMEKGHIVIPEHVTEQPIFNVEVGGGFIYESAVPPKMPDTESLRMDGKEIIVPKGSIDAYKQAFSKYANADELIVKLVEAQ